MYYYEPMPVPLALILIGVIGFLVGAAETGTFLGGLHLAGSLLLFVIALGFITIVLTFLYYLLTGQF